MIRRLSVADLEGADVAHLLWMAAELRDDELDAVRRDELPEREVYGVVEPDRVVALVAFEVTVRDATIHYIAVAEDEQCRGHGRALIDAVRTVASGLAVRAETDDDAVDFYRRLGFEIRPGVDDPRWPGRPRYNCVLAPPQGRRATASS